MTIDDLIRAEQAKITAALERRQTHSQTIEKIRETCLGEQRDPTDEEAKTVRESGEAKTEIDTQIAAARATVEQLETEKRADEEADRLSRETTQTGVRVPGQGGATVGMEARTYNPDGDRTGGSFLRDVGAAFFGDFDARDRLARHMAEERVERGDLTRAAGTGAFAGLTVPQYLTDLYAPAAKAMRPFADVCNKHPLPPDGMTVNISRITTATTVALQASENTGVSETNIDDTLLTVNVLTAAGQQTLSRQAIDRSTGAEDVMLDDLFRSYATTLDSTLITQATTGLSAAVQAANKVAYTDASPTAAELWPKLLDAQARIEGALLDQDSADLAVMHSRRWAWLQSQVGPNWPFIAQMNTPSMTGGADAGKNYGSGYRGTVAGLNVVVDNNIGTALGAGTEDEIFVVAPRECHLWEDPSAPVLIRAEQPAAASLGVLFVVYGYFAYTYGRYPLATAKVYDTGLIAPVF